MRQCEIEGCFNFRNSDLDVVVQMNYDSDGYLDITRMQAWSDRNKGFIDVSNRLMFKFQGLKWDFLYSKCLDYSHDMEEYFRNMHKSAEGI